MNTLLGKLAVDSVKEDVAWMVTFKGVIRHFGLVKYSHSHRYLFNLAFLWVSFVCSILTQTGFREIILTTCFSVAVGSTPGRPESLFRGNLAYRMKMESSSVFYLLGLLTGGSSWFSQLDTL